MNTKLSAHLAQFTDARIMTSQTIGAGLESEVFLVTLSDDSQLIVKLPRSGRTTNYVFEAEAYQKLGQIGAKVPQVLYVHPDVLCLSVIPGRELDNQSDLYSHKTIFTDAARDLAKCQEIVFDEFNGAAWQDFLVPVSAQINSLAETGLVDVADINKLRDYWNKVRSSLDITTGRLVHGDFAMGAIFVNHNQYTGLIDFGDALIGDPLMDLAYFKFKEINKPYGPQTFTNLYEPYRQFASSSLPANAGERINAYMIYWGAKRILDCPDRALRPTFAAKLVTVAKQL